MSEDGSDRQAYMVRVYRPQDAAGELVFTFAPKGLQQAHDADEPPKRVPQFIVRVRGGGENIVFDWSETPDEPGAAKTELEREARQRVEAREAWIARVSDLVRQVEGWAKELGWATRRIEKKLDDSSIGKHQLPALLMQEETYRILLEPVGRSAPGAEGVVDLYLMPAYDDIATLLFYGERWNLHYLFPDRPTSAPVGEEAGVPLSKEALQRVLEEMKRHAA